MKVRDRMLIDKGFSAAEQWHQRSFASGGFFGIFSKTNGYPRKIDY